MPRILTRTTVFSTPWFDVNAKRVKGLPGSRATAYYFSVLPRDYVTVLATTDRDEVLLVRQYRPAVESHTLELPSGLVDRGERPARAARRELSEETGYEASRWEFLGALRPDVGRLENRIWCYRASGLRKNPAAGPPEPGVIPVHMAKREFLRRIRNGRFDHSLHLAVVVLALARTDPGSIRF